MLKKSSLTILQRLVVTTLSVMRDIHLPDAMRQYHLEENKLLFKKQDCFYFYETHLFPFSNTAVP